MTQKESKLETEVVFDRLPVLIGRSKICDLSLDDHLASRQHCVIESDTEGKIRVVDLKSANGTLLNGEKIQQKDFQVGDRIQIGDTLLDLDRVIRLKKEETTVHELEPWDAEEPPETTGTVLKTEGGEYLPVEKLVEKEPEEDLSEEVKKPVTIDPALLSAKTSPPEEKAQAQKEKPAEVRAPLAPKASPKVSSSEKASEPSEASFKRDPAADELSFKTPSMFRAAGPKVPLKSKDWVQVSLFWKGSLLDVKCFDRGDTVSIGKSDNNDFCIDFPSIPDEFSFLRILNDGVELNLGMPATGMVETRGKTRDLEELRASARQTDLGLSTSVLFRDRCLIEIGPFSFFIQSVRLRLAQPLERPLVKESFFSGVLLTVTTAFLIFFAGIHQLERAEAEPEELPQDLVLEIAMPEEVKPPPPPPPPPPPKKPAAQAGERRQEARKDQGAGGVGARAAGAEGRRGREDGSQKTNSRTIGFQTKEAPPARTPPKGSMGEQKRAEAKKGPRADQGTGTSRPKPEATQQAPTPKPKPQVRVEEQGLLGVLGGSGGGGSTASGGQAEGRGLGGELEGAVEGLARGSTVDSRGSGGRGQQGRDFGGGGSSIDVGGLGTAGRGGGRSGFGLGSSGRGGEAEVSFVMEEVEVRDGLTREEIARVVRANEHEVRACYDRALIQSGPSLEGRLEIEWFVNAQGRAVNIRLASGFGTQAGLFDCVASRIRTWQFPRPRGGQGAQVSYPWLLTQGS